MRITLIVAVAGAMLLVMSVLSMAGFKVTAEVDFEKNNIILMMAGLFLLMLANMLRLDRRVERLEKQIDEMKK